MKKLVCFHFDTLSSQRRFVYAYEREMNNAVDSFKPDEKTDKLPKFEDVKAKVDYELTKAGKAQLESFKNGQDVASKNGKKELDDLKGKLGHDKKQKEFDANEKQRVENLKDVDTAIETAKKAARDSLETAYKNIEDKRKKDSDTFATSIAKDVVAAQLNAVPFVKQREKEIGDELDKLGTGWKGMGWKGMVGYRGDNRFKTFSYDSKTGISKEEQPVAWGKADMEVATKAMLQSIYYENGKGAAMGKANELVEAAKINPKSGNNIDYFAWKTAMGGDDRGGFDYVRNHDICHMEDGGAKNPELFGRVVGYMNVANTLFVGDGNKQYFDRYESYVREETKKGTTTGKLLSPTEWASEKAPGFFLATAEVKEGDKKALEQAKSQYVDQLVKIMAPGKPDLSTPEGIELDRKMNLVRSVIFGLIDNEPDPKKWDALIRAEMEKITDSYKIDQAALMKADPSKLMEGREIYGKLGGQLDDYAKTYISTLIYAGDSTLGGKSYKEKSGDKEIDRDAMDGYKRYLDKALAGNTNLGGAILAIESAMNTKRANAPRISTYVDGKQIFVIDPKEKAQIEKEYRDKLNPLLRDTLLSPSEFYKQKTEGEEKPATPAVKPGAAKPKTFGKKPAAKSAEGGTVVPAAPAAAPTAPSAAPKAAPAATTAAAPSVPAKPEVVATAAAAAPEAAPAATVAVPEAPTPAHKTFLKYAEQAIMTSSGAVQNHALFVEEELTKYVSDNKEIVDGKYSSPSNGIKFGVATVEGKRKVTIIGATEELKNKLGITDESVATMKPPAKKATAVAKAADKSAAGAAS